MQYWQVRLIYMYTVYVYLKSGYLCIFNISMEINLMCSHSHLHTHTQLPSSMLSCLSWTLTFRRECVSLSTVASIRCSECLAQRLWYSTQRARYAVHSHYYWFIDLSLGSIPRYKCSSLHFHCKFYVFMCSFIRVYVCVMLVCVSEADTMRVDLGWIFTLPVTSKNITVVYVTR